MMYKAKVAFDVHVTVQNRHCVRQRRATSSEQCTHLAAQRYTTQAAFQGWSPNAVVIISTPDDGHADSRKLHMLSHLVGSLPYTKVAVCSDIRTKHSTQSEHHVEFF
jgi:hypothetical protein